MNEIWQDALNKGLHGVFSHPDPTTVLDDVDWETAGKRVSGMPHTLWQIARHIEAWAWAGIRKLQGAEFSDSRLGENYFPAEDAPPSREEWETYKLALKQLPEELAKVAGEINPAQRFPEWYDITAAQVVMVVLTHTSYHTAQIVALRRLLGVWKSN